MKHNVRQIYQTLSHFFIAPSQISDFNNPATLSPLYTNVSTNNFVVFNNIEIKEGFFKDAKRER